MFSPRTFVLLAVVAFVLRGPSAPPDRPGTPVRAMTVVGTQTGHFAVNANGAATYTMDLDVPPGTRGAAPALSIAYVSQGANGLLGNGFALQGLSSIARCQASLKLDGFDGGVAFDANDRFCLDGRRLVKVAGGGPYAAAGSVYHTVDETWTQVTAVGTCGAAPCSFTAQNKEGSTLLFGIGDSAAPLPGRKDIAAWQIQSTTDLNGNRVAVSYQFDPATQQNLPIEIRYTENDAANLAATRKVTFEYQRRAQTVPRYTGGVLFLMTKRLAAIHTWLDGAPVLDYSFTYRTGGGTGRDLLVSFQKCAPQSGCFPATTFAWQDEGAAVTSPNSDPAGNLFPAAWCTEANALTGWADFNGDGLPDVHCDTPAGDHRVLLSTGTGLRSPNADARGLVKTRWCSGARTSWVDFNGDGKADLACDGADGSHRVLVSDGTSVRSPNADPMGLIRSNWCGEADAIGQWGNFDADGRADLLCSNRDDGLQRVLVSTGTGVASPNADAGGIVATSWCAGSGTSIFWSDFNGDRRSDARCATNGGLQQVLLSNGTTLVSPNSDAGGTVATSWCAGNGLRRGTADFNADGLRDATCSSDDGRQWVMLSTGRALVSPNAAADGLLRTSWCTGSGAVTGWSDFNGDGLADLQCRDGSARVMALVSDGATLRSPNASPDGVLRTGWCTAPAGTPAWTDFNADSLGDLTCSTSGSQQSLVHAAGAPDLVGRITDGMAMTIDLTYAPLTDAAVYTAGDPVSYPLLDVRPPMYVVSRHVKNDGRGSSYAFRHTYQGARTDLTAQRWLGFQQVAFTDESIGRRTVTRYMQEYPVIAFVTSVSVFDVAGRPLSTAGFTPLVRTPFPNVNQVLTASQTSSTYTNGIADAAVTASYDYDSFGNVTYADDVSAPYFAVYTCRQYANSTKPWRLGYATAEKTTRTKQSCLDFAAGNAPAWNPATDLRWSTIAYDARMNAAAHSSWDNVNAAFLTVARTFDAAGNVLTQSDPAGNVTALTWDATLTFPLTRVSPPLGDGRTLTLQYAFFRQFGVNASTTDANGNVRAQQIDGLGRVTQHLGPDPAASTGAATVLLRTFTYAQDANGIYTEVRERQMWAGSDPSTWFYSRRYVDGLGRIVREQRRSARAGLDVVTETQFDASGRASKESVPHYSSDPPSFRVTVYDALDRPTTVTEPDGMITKTEYLRGDLEVRTTEAFGTALARTVTDTNDPRQRILRRVAANGGVTASTYDALGQLVTNVRPTGSSTNVTYDSLGRTVKRVDSDRGTTTWTYGTDALLQATTTGAGGTVTFAYDALNRPVRRTLAPGTAASATYTFAYDDPTATNAQGHVSSVTGPAYAEEYAYSRYALVSAEQLTIDGNVYTDRVDYDPQGRTSLRTFADGSVLRTTRFADGTLLAQDLQDAGATSFTNIATYMAYSALGQPESLTYGNGLATNITYYPVATGMARTQALSVAGNATLLTRTYAWNPLSELTAVQWARSGETPQSESYTYDLMGSLTAASGPYGDLTYAYDLSGNIVSKDGVAYRNVAGSDLLQDASSGATFRFDGAGNRSGKDLGSDAWEYRHDAAGRLTTVLRNGAVTGSYDYDSHDLRIRRADASGNISTYVAQDLDVSRAGNSVVLTKYVQGVLGPVCAITTAYTPQSLRQLLRRQSAQFDTGRHNTASLRGLALHGLAFARVLLLDAHHALAMSLLFIAALTTAFLLLLRMRRPAFAPFLICGLLLLTAQELRGDLGPGGGYPAAGTRYFHGDQVDNTVLVTDAEGTEATRVAYRPFGVLDQPRSSGADDFRPKFATRERDAESGLDYFGARYYDSATGRFLEPDPESQFTSAYVYGGNDPLAMVDGNGRFAFLAVLIIAAIVGAYFGASAVNHTFNPVQWHWSSGRTFAGIFAGAALGAAGALAGAAAAAAEVAAGIAGEIVIAGGENAAFTALGGGSAKEVGESALVGAAIGAIAAGAGEGLSVAFTQLAEDGSRLARRAETEVLATGSDEASEESSVSCAQVMAGEWVATEEGLRPAGTLKPGALVLATRDGVEEKPFLIVTTGSGTAAAVVNVAVGGTIVTTAPEHPFWVVARGWTAAAELRPGDELLTMQSTRVAVEDVTWAAGRGSMVSIEVADAHTYFLSSLLLLTHNSSCTTRSRRKEILKKGHDTSDIRGGKRVRRAVDRYGSGITRRGKYVSFGGLVQRRVTIELQGSNYWDFKLADAAAGIKSDYRKARQLTWHHAEGLVNHGGKLHSEMQLVPTLEHAATFHHGGVEEYRRLTGGGYGS